MLRHPDFPTAPSGTPTPEMDTWQATHTPVVTLTVWLGPAGTMAGMVAVRWAPEVRVAQRGGGVVPVEEMGVAAALLYKASEQLLEQIAPMLEPVTRTEAN